MPTLYTSWAFSAWVCIWVVWLLGYIGVKKTVRGPTVGKYLSTTVLLMIGFLLLFSLNLPGVLGMNIIPHTDVLGIIGVVIAYVSSAFAIWARVTIGKNWSGATATIKENHELMQTGPYAFVRHPIYTGFLGTAFGTALTIGITGSFLGVIFLLVAFLMRIHMEERVMTEQFSDIYPNYKKKTKALIPFVI